MRRLLLTILVLLTMTTAPVLARAESTGWLGLEEVKVANFGFIEQWLIPTDFAVRVRDGVAEYRVEWGENPGDPFGFRIYPLSSRAAAEEMIELHRDPEDLPLSPIDKLCLAKFARAEAGGVEAWMVYLTENEVSGLRCIRLPKQ